MMFLLSNNQPSIKLRQSGIAMTFGVNQHKSIVVTIWKLSKLKIARLVLAAKNVEAVFS